MKNALFLDLVYYDFACCEKVQKWNKLVITLYPRFQYTQGKDIFFNTRLCIYLLIQPISTFDNNF